MLEAPYTKVRDRVQSSSILKTPSYAAKCMIKIGKVVRSDQAVLLMREMWGACACMKRYAVIVVLIVNPYLVIAAPAVALDGGDQLVQNFMHPPEIAKPRVWWHWMDGNVTQEGIRADLEWMHRVGIGGLQVFDASMDTPAVVDHPLVYMTPAWKEAFLSATRLAEQYGMELAVAGSPGFSESGGPWVLPEQGMKKLVWSESWVTGGAALTTALPTPPTSIGPFQDVVADRSKNSPSGPPPAVPVSEYYKDIAVVAFRPPPQERPMSELHPAVTSSAGAIDENVLWDGHFSSAVHLPDNNRRLDAWIQLDFGYPQVMQSMSLGLQDFGSVLEPRRIGAELQSSTDGIHFHHVADAYDTADYAAEALAPIQQTVTFHPVSARYFRLRLPPLPHVTQLVDELLGPIPTEHKVTEFVLYNTPRVEHFEQKAGYFLDAGVSSHSTRHVASRDAISLGDVIDLTRYLRPDGTLTWTPPDGRWVILRMGYSLLGVTNEAASPPATGLEVDKLSRSSVQAHMENYLGRFDAFLGAELVGRRGLHAMVNDSWEAGAQNWTEKFPAEFARRRGYSLYRWMPALEGRIIESAEMTDRFLWDFRRTLAELLTENHYGQIATSLHARGMIHYGESHEASRAFIGDGMDAKRDDDIPMGAMWMPGFPSRSQAQGDADLRETASVAHIYGQNLVAAESLTTFGSPDAAYAFAPEDLKPTVDRELADGVNLFVLHTSVHQPTIKEPPGLTLGPFGQWFTRYETWAEQATPWVTYLARSAYLLQQGHFVADIIYYYGQESNITALYPTHMPAIPQGYAFDFASAHALTLLSVKSGDLVTTSGMRYRLLALDPRIRLMSLDILRTIARLVSSGATVVGAKPQGTPSLADNVDEFRDIVDTLWGSGTGERHYGMGKVLGGQSIAAAVATLKLKPDFDYTMFHPDNKVWFVHRHLDDCEIYFIDNRHNVVQKGQGRFRVNGRVPELWHADTGVVEAVSYRQETGVTVVPLSLDPNEAVFVVFRRYSQQPTQSIVPGRRRLLGVINGPWSVTFQPGRGAPDRTVLTRLESWSRNPDPGIRYFSGIAEYKTTLDVPAPWLVKGQQVKIDLGVVKNVAEVMVNGYSAGIAWKAPYSVDLTTLLKPGINAISVRVANLWVNRLIGDRQTNVSRITSTSFNPYRADSRLLDSGLLGPVSVICINTVEK